MIGIHVLFAAHFVHWKLAKQTLAPLEFNEVMHTLELGGVTAGFRLMAVAFLATLIFGRFFCGWGCHFLAMQDSTAWLLRRIGLRPKRLRSRVLLLVPLGAAFYMFLWPALHRMLQGEPHPSLRIGTDESGWASFVTEDFWRNLPGPGVTLATFLGAGGLLVYFGGSRAFCRYVCPYGAIFGFADRFAPGRLRRSGDCSACGLCTAACSSGIAVHEELRTMGTVVDPHCLKDLDCVAACPSGAIKFGFAKAPIFAGFRRGSARPGRGMPLKYEIAALTTFLAVLFAWRGLYDLVPFFLAMAMGVMGAVWILAALRMWKHKDVELGALSLKRGGSLTRAGRIFIGGIVIALVATLHAGALKVANRLGCDSPHHEGALDSDIARASAMLGWAHAWSLAPWPSLERQLAGIRTIEAARAHARGDLLTARAALCDLAHLEPRSAAVRDQYAAVLLESGDVREALQQFALAVQLDPSRSSARHNYAVALAFAKRLPEAVREAEAAVRLAPNDPESSAFLSYLRGLVR